MMPRFVASEEEKDQEQDNEAYNKILPSASGR